MRKALLYIILLVNIPNLNAQTWAPVGTKWTYSLSSYMAFQSVPTTIKCIGDTVIQSKVCRIFNSNIYGSSIKTYLYYENERIYKYINSKVGFHILYDFTAKAGDSLTIIQSDEEGDTSIIIVDSIGTEIISGKTFSVQYVRNLTPYSDYWIFEGKIIKGIGNVNYFFPRPASSMHIYFGPLRCYEDSIRKLKFSKFPCDTVFGSIFRPDNHVDTINIYPNPIVSDVFVEFNFLRLFEFEIELYSDLGCKLIELKGANKMEVKIPMEQFSKGIYFLKITTSTGQRIVRKIVKA